MNHPGASQRLALASGAGAYILWGLLTVYWHELHGLNAMELIGQRIWWSAVVLAIVLTVRRRWPAMAVLWHRPDLAARIALAGLMLAVNWTAYVWAVTHGNVVEAALGYFLAPLGAIGVGVLVLGEHLSRAQRIALVLAFVSVVILTVQYGRPPWLALTIAVTWTAYGWLKRTVAMPAVEGLAGEAFALLIPAIGVIAVVESGDHAVTAEASSAQLGLLCLAGVATIVPLLMFAHAAKRIPLTTLGRLNYLVPTINFVLGVSVYDESLPGWRLVGFMLVWMGLALTALDGLVRFRRDRTSAPRVAPAR